ncbi:hypothetical protein [Mycetocola saprophilus]|uniref:hypothetical protein n=1 Tax=Mycetocola saprophilus TaxID=76636 RepID=UPI003BF187BB
MNLTVTPTRTAAQTRLVALFALILPALAGLAAAGLIRTWRDDLPAEVITHWGLAGEANGWTSAAWLPVVVGLPILGVALLLGLLILLPRAARGGRLGIALLSGFSCLFGGLLATLLPATVIRQRTGPGQDDPSVLIPFFVVAVAWVALSVLGTILIRRALPADVATPEHEANAPTLNLPADTRAVWIASASIGTLMRVVLGVVLLGLITLLAWQLLVDSEFNPVAAIITAVIVVVLVSVLSMFSWRLRADRAGFRAHATLGWPRVEIPLDEIVGAHVVEVNPVADFGGWGWRVGANRRLGIILRSGSALEVERRDGRRLVITLADPQIPAALLNTLVQRGERPASAAD